MQITTDGWLTTLASLWQRWADISIAWGGRSVSLTHWLGGALAGLLVLLVVWWLGRQAERRLLRWVPAGDLSLQKMVSSTWRSLVVVAAVLLSLAVMGIDLTALAVVSGAIGVGIGLGLQKLASNYISGFVILAERSVRIGDWVRVSGFEGRVTDIRARSTTLRDNTGVEAVIPNETLTVERVENLSLSDSLLWLSVDVVLAPGTNPDQAAAVLEAAAAGQPRVLQNPAPTAALAALAPDGLRFTLGFWIADPQNGQLGVRSAVNRAVVSALAAAGIDLAVPQRIWRLDTEV